MSACAPHIIKNNKLVFYYLENHLINFFKKTSPSFQICFRWKVTGVTSPWPSSFPLLFLFFIFYLFFYLFVLLFKFSFLLIFSSIKPFWLIVLFIIILPFFFFEIYISDLITILNIYIYIYIFSLLFCFNINHFPLFIVCYHMWFYVRT